MYESVKELLMALRAFYGINAQMLHPNARNGGPAYPIYSLGEMERFCRYYGLDMNKTIFPDDVYSIDGNSTCAPSHPLAKLCMANYDWSVNEADVQSMHWKGDSYSEKLRPLVFAAHGTFPEYCLSTEIFSQETMGSPFTGTLERHKKADLSICFTKRQKWFMDKLSFGDTRYVPFGIDLSRFTPRGTMIKDIDYHPTILYLEQWREIKLPDTFIYAIRELEERIPTVRMCIAGAEADPYLLDRLADSLGISWRFTPAPHIMSHITYPEHFYRAVDVFFNPIVTGESSRTGREAMACGTPAINYVTRPEWGDAEPFMGRANLFDPVSIADNIEAVWRQAEKAPKKMKKECRRRAVKAWDVKNTAAGFAAAYSEVFDRYEVEEPERVEG